MSLSSEENWNRYKKVVGHVRITIVCNLVYVHVCAHVVLDQDSWLNRDRIVLNTNRES
jgi:hypothetical protein